MSDPRRTRTRKPKGDPPPQADPVPTGDPKPRPDRKPNGDPKPKADPKPEGDPTREGPPIDLDPDPRGPIEGGPIEHDDPTVPDEFTFSSMFRALDRGLPLALLPLRLEVRWWMASTPPELRVRIFPDVVHADGHQPELTAGERELGMAFWRRCWRAGPLPGSIAGHDAAFAWLAGQTGPWRAAWVAQAMEPANPQDAPPRPVPEASPLVPPPRFPGDKPRAAGGPTYARLLPTRFALVLMDKQTPLGTWWGEEVASDLPFAPGLVDAGDAVDGRALLDAQGLTWTYDFEAAIEAGMAIRVNFSELDERFLRDGFSQVLVLGVRTTDQQAELDALLTAHRYTHGLDFIPQGTPTNATETAAPTISLQHPDLAAVRRQELGIGKLGLPPVIEGHREAPPQNLPTAELEDGELFRMTAATAVSTALGLGDDGALQLAGNASLAELPRAEAMAKALWPGLGGHYLDALMQIGMNAANRAWLRDWSAGYVRAGGVLPTLLIGTQPYGLLPVSRGDEPVGTTTGRIQHLLEVLATVQPTWLAAVPALPRLDPESGDDAPGAGERAALVSQILGAVPHPTGFTLQWTDDERADYASAWDRSLIWTMLGAAAAPFLDGSTGSIGQLPGDWTDTSADETFDGPMWRPWIAVRDLLLDASTPEEQLAALEQYRFTLESNRDNPFGSLTREFYEGWERFVREDLMGLVQAHVDRTEPIRWLTEYAPGFSRMMGDVNDPSAAFAMYPTRADLALPVVAPGRTEEDVADLVAWLGALEDDVAAGRTPEHDYGEAHPLLRQMLVWSAEQAVDTPDAESVREGLATLTSLARTAADPVGELERLLREAVSTHANRLDAWYTGVAAARLEGKRQATPAGIQVGAYGWLEDVRPRQRRATQGYVLAPSPAHATTAAILRSGWSAFGGAVESAGLAVDLSSDRIRRARWLMDGVRKGQDLGALLGARLERRLLDAGLAGQTEDLRSAALRAAESTAPPTAIVDGLLVARGRAFQEAPADEQDGYNESEQAMAGELAALLASSDLSASERTRFGATLDDGLGDLDAVADAALAQSVFSLVEGNVPEATATLTATATGEMTFPRLRVADGRRPALSVTHKLLLLVTPGLRGDWPAAGTSGRALASPALEAWLEQALGDPGRIKLRVGFRDPATGDTAAPSLDRSLEDVGLAALDVVELAPAGEDAGLGRLGAVLASWAETQRPAGLTPEALVELETGIGDPSVDDLAVACRALRALLDDARDLDGRDLAAPGATDAASGLVSGDLEKRIDAVRKALEVGQAALEAAVGSGRDVRPALLALSGFVLPGEADAALVAIEDRLVKLDARIHAEDAGWEGRDEVSRSQALRDRLFLLLGQRLPLAPSFIPADGSGLAATFGRPRLSPGDATRWLAAVGRVDPGARRLRLASDLGDALGGGTAFAFSLGQLPDHADEEWAAVTRPVTDDRARLCLLATGNQPAFGAGPAAGLVLGAWNEAIPRVTRTAALGVHFDSPAARAPQAVLLCTADEEDGFSFELVCDLVLQTFLLARLRLVGPQELGALGQYLPVSYLHGGIPARTS